MKFNVFFLFQLSFASVYAAQHHALNLFQNWDIESLEPGYHWGIQVITVNS
jgi:hypothetical protein